MKKRFIITRLFTIVLAALFTYSCTSFAQDSKHSKSKKKAHTEYVKLKIEKDDEGKITKIDTIFSSSELNCNGYMKTFTINVPDFDEEIEKSIEAEINENFNPFDCLKNFHVTANDSLVDINIMNKIRIECDGEEGHESVKIYTSDDDDSWVEKVYKKALPDKNGKIQKQKTFVIKIDDDGVEINGKKEKGKKNKKCKIVMTTVVDDEETTDEKKKDNGKEPNKFKKLDVADLVFSPNPGNGIFNLEFTLEKKGDVEINITDLNGKEVFNEKMKNFKGKYKKEIDISENSKGVYLLNIKQDNRQISKKIVIQ